MESIARNQSLKEYNTFGLDVCAEHFTQCSTIEEIKAVVSWQKKNNHKLLLLGGGSNVLLRNDVSGLVLRNELKGVELFGEDEDCFFVKVGAGEVWHEFVMTCVENGWAGLENLSLIPGSVGAGPMQNIGAYGVELEQRFLELEALHLESGEVHVFSHSDCEFGYRESVFKRKLKGEYCIVSVTFKLLKLPELKVEYGAIKSELEKGNEPLTIRSVSNAVIAIRSSKLPNPAEIGNSGSFFKNPIVERSVYEQVHANHPGLVAYPSGDQMKLAAGWLIDQAGWKGHDRGGYGVHDKQA
ncbi:MAG: UDP-N-acetylmuramate dehydrogenase, partial [Flavobacteriales bacterium]